MSRRLGLRLVPDRVVDDVADAPDVVRRSEEPARTDDDPEGRDQPPALGATAAATPSR
jgi:hypothetical protein